MKQKLQSGEEKQRNLSANPALRTMSTQQQSMEIIDEM
jgi:hypothetical protein